MLSMKAKYALKALLALARQGGDGPTGVAQIAERERIPEKFLGLILLELKGHGLLASKKGKGGGYQLAQAPDTIRVGDVVRFIDGATAPLPCLDRARPRRCDECHDEHSCAIKKVVGEAWNAEQTVLDGSTLADLLHREAHAERPRIFRYHI